MILKSPLLQSEVDFKQGGTDLGKTQYIDAFQRGFWWSAVQKNTKWHVLLAKATGAAGANLQLQPIQLHGGF